MYREKLVQKRRWIPLSFWLLFLTLLLCHGKVVYARDYIIPGSDSRYLTESDVEGLSLREINYAKNEIFARHGRKFNLVELQTYFAIKSWYTPIYEAADFDANYTSVLLNDYEKTNGDFLATIEHNIDPNGYQLDTTDYMSFIEAESVPETEAIVYEDAWSAYRALLEFGQVTPFSGGDTYNILSFHVLDIANDGEPEMLVWFDSGSIGSTLIFFQDGHIAFAETEFYSGMAYQFYPDTGTFASIYDRGGMTSTRWLTYEGGEYTCKVQRVMNYSENLDDTMYPYGYSFYTGDEEISEMEYVLTLAPLISEKIYWIDELENTEENRSLYLAPDNLSAAASGFLIADMYPEFDETIYSYILSLYAKAENGNYFGDYTEDYFGYISSYFGMYTYPDTEGLSYDLYYTLYDFLGDGIPELLIGVSCSYDGEPDGTVNSIIDVYSTDGEKVGSITGSGEYTYSFGADGTVICNWAASSGETLIYQLQRDTIGGIWVDGIAHSGSGECYRVAENGEYEEISYDEYMAVLDSRPGLEYDFYWVKLND